ncbi:MAG: alpha/beta hydrolase [Campylobacteraceae bacterium]|nr:alpha/beta hydrolase [Campylobacteraceae bacterium]
MAKKTILVENITYDMSYELLNLHNEQAILFLHGWGSNKEAMKSAFKECFKEYKHIYLDLPGFGHSSITLPIATLVYADIVSAFLKQLDIQPSMIFGHSYGGKIATLLKPEVLVLLSSAGIVTPKSFKVKMKILIYKTFKPFFPKSFYRFFATKDVEGMSQTMYEILKMVVNEDFSIIFTKVKSPTYIFWGESDKATPLSSGQKMHSLIPNSHFTKMTGDHFFFLKNGQKIEKLLLESKI